ncbi:hypothetical protein ACPCBX_27095 [Streptomyces tuirus]|uniref:Uncharacterized protein n=1 Tax=Streptomyces tuirus TaxID=68278 RepID=A0A7G1NPP9_9ACTN|nr:hypothetical protein [Streptomyces tuirus]BCL23486.1 hypothetical protein GCM10017668_53290 [Streptomyces tuirus]
MGWKAGSLPGSLHTKKEPEGWETGSLPAKKKPRQGPINKVKAEVAAEAAQHAIDAGRHVLVYKFIEADQSRSSTGPMTGMNDQIEAIEALGWTLDKMSATQSEVLTGSIAGFTKYAGHPMNERIALVCIFRRS